MPNPNNPVFPAALATDLDLMVATNRALSKLTLPIDAGQTSFTVVDGSKFQVPCLVQIDTEVIRVGAKSGNVLQTCTRGFALTSATAHAQNTDVKGYIFSYHHNQLAAEVKSVEAGLGVNFGNVVMQYDTAGGDIQNVFTNLRLRNNGVTAGTYGGFDQNIVVTVDATGRVTSIANSSGNKNYPIIYKAAIIQGNNAVLGFSFANLNAPNAVAYAGSNGVIYATANFQNGQNYWVQDHYFMPDDWVGDVVSLDIVWRCAATTGNVTWQCQIGAAGNGDSPDVTFGNIRSVTTAVPATTLTVVKSRISPLDMAHVSAGKELFFKFLRSDTDTAVADAELISLKFNINRNFALVP
jgi:hypothetical protein